MAWPHVVNVVVTDGGSTYAWAPLVITTPAETAQIEADYYGTVSFSSPTGTITFDSPELIF